MKEAKRYLKGPDFGMRKELRDAGVDWEGDQLER